MSSPDGKTSFLVIVHWNSPYLLGCLRSFLQPGTEGVDVVLVDNASIPAH